MNNSELPKGYKLTEVGMVPEDWDVYCLDAVSKLSSGTTPSRSQQDRYYQNGQYYWVKTTDLNNSRITTTEEKITQAALDETCLQIYPPGTVFVAMYGGFNQIGRTGILEVSAAVNQALIAIQTKPKKLDSAYLLANLNYRVEHWKSIASSSRKDPNITSQDVRNFVVPLPSLPEQRSIATALSDMDELLGGLDRLIAKKRDLKQATMQQLLTGKTRLPEFGKGKSYKQTEIGIIPEDWDVKLLEDIFNVGNGFSFKSEYFSSNGPIVLTPGNFKLGGGLYFNDRNTKRYSGNFPESTIFKEGDLLVVMTDLTPDCNLLGKPAFVYSEEKILHNQRIGKIQLLSKNFDKQFLYFIFLSSAYLKKIKDQATGSTVRHTSNSSIYGVSLPIPKLEEQTAIASILSDMDTEIAAIEQRRNKIRDLKQAMMQELLTGRIRLV